MILLRAKTIFFGKIISAFHFEREDGQPADIGAATKEGFLVPPDIAGPLMFLLKLNYDGLRQAAPQLLEG